MWRPKEDLSGRQFGRWIVLGQDEQKTSYWICQCSCENQTIKSVYRDSLIKGKSESCGCLQREVASKCNRKCNLRIVTPAQNGYNKGIQPYNTSGEIGVYFNKRKKKWVAQIIYDGKHYCAYYNSKEEAIVGRRKLENDLFGEYSYHYSIDINTEQN